MTHCGANICNFWEIFIRWRQHAGWVMNLWGPRISARWATIVVTTNRFIKCFPTARTFDNLMRLLNVKQTQRSCSCIYRHNTDWSLDCISIEMPTCGHFSSMRDSPIESPTVSSAATVAPLVQNRTPIVGTVCNFVALYIFLGRAKIADNLAYSTFHHHRIEMYAHLSML